MNQWWQYVTTVAGTDNQSEIARHTGIDNSTVSRWKSRGPGTGVNSVGEFAKAYGRPVMEAFVAAGYLPADEIDAEPSPLASIPTQDLASEIARRLA